MPEKGRLCPPWPLRFYAAEKWWAGAPSTNSHPPLLLDGASSPSDPAAKISGSCKVSKGAPGPVGSSPAQAAVPALEMLQAYSIHVSDSDMQPHTQFTPVPRIQHRGLSVLWHTQGCLAEDALETAWSQARV